MVEKVNTENRLTNEQYVLALKTHFGIVRNISTNDIFVKIIGEENNENVYYFKYLDKEGEIKGMDRYLEATYMTYYGENRKYDGWK